MKGQSSIQTTSPTFMQSTYSAGSVKDAERAHKSKMETSKAGDDKAKSSNTEAAIDPHKRPNS